MCQRWTIRFGFAGDGYTNGFPFAPVARWPNFSQQPLWKRRRHFTTFTCSIPQLDTLESADAATTDRDSNNETVCAEATPAFETPEEARAEAKLRSARIHDHYDLLNTIVVRHEEAIHTKWPKESRKQKLKKLKLLLDAWPGMSANHRPDFHAFRKNADSDSEDFEPLERLHFMWPHINEEDLTRPNNLLLMINSRG
ncbi:hypothetical protein B0T14DRAFT_561380 [Immersiella caudata]|uniref:Uncharacterized protein n=1 Tax=Immersiella caudata TaxID=314043 RepID=A0AA39XHQ0_9PEZI|nr:hypothetical protein B0T14DRAFT_561380 [Immersiella caudata]